MPRAHATTSDDIAAMRAAPKSHGPPSELDPLPLKYLPVGRVEAEARRCRVGVPRGWVDGTDDERPATARYARNWLLLDGTSRDTQDRVWRHIAANARDQDNAEHEDWNLYALAVGFAGIFNRARRLSPKGVAFEWLEDVQFTLMIEFLFAMHDPKRDFDRGNVFSRILGKAYDVTSGRTKRRRRQRRRRADETYEEWVRRLERLDEETCAETSRLVKVEDQEWVLDMAAQDERYRLTPVCGDGGVAAVHALLDRVLERSARLPVHDRLQPENVTLIRRTYIDGERLDTVAAELGISPENASKRRTRAVSTVLRLLGDTLRGNVPPAERQRYGIPTPAAARDGE